MRRLILASTFSLGCAASTPATPTTPEPGVSERLASLEAEAERREQEVEELRSRLALAQAEAEELRAASPVPPRETVRIGGEPRSTDEDGSFFEDGEGDWEVPAETLPEPEDEPEPEARGSRPVLRLYGAPEAPAPASGPWSPPEGTVSAREASGAAWSRPQGIQLPDTPLRPIPAPRGMTPTAAAPAVAPVPIPTATASAAPAPARAPAPRADGALEAYRDALGALRARRFGEAEAA
ncbi:MAG TPA: hypothetical protein RMG45_12080, partial [Polyangiaceae bacterium LLY-WYZ-15_(1-7)]|nr:hypothetical protein [Polyangiaceae bacterium LLY-WYZ-15_(1-7)]